MAHNELDKLIASVAVLPSEKLRALAREVARKLGPDAVQGLVERLTQPAISAEAAGVDPIFAFEWPWKWTIGVLEILGGLGLEGAAALWPLVDDVRQSVALLALVILFRMPATVAAEERNALLTQLRERLPKFHRPDIPIYPIVSSLLTEARKNPAIGDVLKELGDVVVLDPKKKKVVLGGMARGIVSPPPPPPKPAELPEHKEFAERFAATLVSHDLVTLHAMLAPNLQKKKSAAKLEQEIAKMSSHCGWPVRHEEASFGGFRAAELRSGIEFRLPKSISDASYRNWLWVQFLPAKDSDSDFAFNMGLALVEAGGELKVGFFWMTAED